MNISIELQNQLHITYEDDTYLLRKATERYCIELENYYETFIENPSFYQIRVHGINEYNSIQGKFNKYRKMIIDFENNNLKKKKSTIQALSEKCMLYECSAELDFLEKKGIIVIRIMDILNKCSFPNLKSNLSILKTICSRYAQYDLIDSILVLKKELERIGAEIINPETNIMLDDLDRILQDIPRNYWELIINHLGFTVKNKQLFPI